MPVKIRRRQLLRNTALMGIGLGASPLLSAAGQPALKLARTSLFGYWSQGTDLPAFVYDTDQDRLPQARWDPVDRPHSNRHFHVMGNRALQVEVSNTGDVALFDESEGMRWLIYGDDTAGTGHSLVTEANGHIWGSSFQQRPRGPVPLRTIGCTHFSIEAEQDGLRLSRTLLCPEGDLPWILVKVHLQLDPAQEARRITHTERWNLRPRFLQIFQPEALRDAAAAAVSYQGEPGPRRIVAREKFARDAAVIGAPAGIMLDALTEGQTLKLVTESGNPHPALEAKSSFTLAPGAGHTLWFRVGREDSETIEPQAVFEDSLAQLSRRLPRASSTRSSAVGREIPWHAAVLSGGANRDRLLGGHTLNQASVYGFGLGGNAAARDQLQHALPLVYSEPDLALSVLRNTCAWGSPDGDLPYALTGEKQPLLGLFRPSDQNLWALWLASEYAAVTGDLKAFSEEQPYHPGYAAPSVSLEEHLVRQFRFFVDKVGRGERDHVSLLNADWNDMVLEDTGLDKAQMIASGSSVLNSAMASWVLSVFAPLLDKLGRRGTAEEARALSEELRQLVAASWNGRWFDRAYGPGDLVVGRDRCWLEVQPWAILCGAADTAQARKLIDVIKSGHCAGSPLGARVIWPPDHEQARVGQGTTGGIWYSINMTLVWAAASVDPDFAWNQWQAMTLDRHTRSFPHIWEGTLSGPDAWNAPEADRPGHTWTTPRFSMQAYPVSNMHSHGQPLLAYLRLLGVAPQADGSLGIGTGSLPGSFESSVLSLATDGTGWLKPGAKSAVAIAGRTTRKAGDKLFF